MDVSMWSTAIATLGFPIVMCGAMAWYVKDTNDKHVANINRLNEQHQHEVKEMTNAINNNTIALQSLCDKINKED